MYFKNGRTDKINERALKKFVGDGKDLFKEVFLKNSSFYVIVKWYRLRNLTVCATTKLEDRTSLWDVISMVLS